MVVLALLLLIVAVLLVVAAVFGGGDPTTFNLGFAHVNLSAGGAFFAGVITLLLIVLSLGLFRGAARRASARRADRKKVSELSNKLDEYKREERADSEDER